MVLVYNRKKCGPHEIWYKYKGYLNKGVDMVFNRWPRLKVIHNVIMGNILGRGSNLANMLTLMHGFQ